MVSDRALAIILTMLLGTGIGLWYFQRGKNELAGLPYGLGVHDSAEFDFGEVFAGEFVKHTFTLQNTTPHAIHIDDVRATCGCLIAKPEAIGSIIASNETFEFPVALNTESRSGEQAVSVHISWHIRNGDTGNEKPVTEGTEGSYPTERQHSELRLVGRVRSVIEVEPNEIDFGTLRPNENSERQVRISRGDGGDVHKISFSVAGLGLEVEEINAPSEDTTGEETSRSERWIRVRVNPGDSSVGTRIQGAVNLECEDVPGIGGHGYIRVVANVASKLRCQPSHIVLIDPTRTSQTIVFNRASGVTAKEVSLSEGLKPFVKIEMDGENGFTARLIMEAIDQLESKSIEGEVLIGFQDENGDDFQSTVRVLVVRDSRSSV
jgi:hypothetical protein